MPNGSLVISDVTTDDTGRYTCVAGNSCSIKDRVAKLYVVGEFTTHASAQTCVHSGLSSVTFADWKRTPQTVAEDEGIN